MTKLSPNVTDIKVMVRAVEEAGTDSISLINTIPGMVIDVEKRRPVLTTITGGLSGPCDKTYRSKNGLRGGKGRENADYRNRRNCHGIRRAGILIAGASAIQVGTANFLDPEASIKVLEGIENYMKRHSMKKVGGDNGKFEVGLFSSPL